MSTSIDKFIGSKLQGLRQESGRSIADICQNIGISSQKWRNYEQGLERVISSDLVLITNELGLPIESFFPEDVINHKHETNILELRQEALRIINEIESCEALSMLISVMKPLR